MTSTAATVYAACSGSALAWFASERASPSTCALISVARARARYGMVQHRRSQGAALGTWSWHRDGAHRDSLTAVLKTSLW